MYLIKPECLLVVESQQEVTPLETHIIFWFVWLRNISDHWYQQLLLGTVIK